MSLDLRVSDDPVPAMRRWYARACAELLRDDAHRIALATVGADGVPSVRIVLCRAIDDAGALYFYTNYNSAKGQDLTAHPYAALVFHWPALGRQLRVTGAVQRTSAEVSDAYWRTRPRESQVSALCSPQSRAIESVQALLERRRAVEDELGEAVIPRPAHWGGYAVQPQKIEFWQEGRDRFHERILFTAEGSRWRGELLGA